MTSSASPAAWLPSALARTVVRVAPSAPPPRAGGRHLAPETPGIVRIATPEDVVRSGRHSEPEWSRDVHDARRDAVDALDWLGFAKN